jgi:hypothetical protein
MQVAAATHLSDDGRIVLHWPDAFALDADPAIYLIDSPLWHLFRRGQRAECRIARSRWGFDGQFFIDDGLLIALRFPTVSEALAWTDQRFREMQQRGWSQSGREN